MTGSLIAAHAAKGNRLGAGGVTSREPREEKGMSIRAVPLAAIVVAAVMLLPAAAGAKEIESAVVCGADGCKEIAVKGDAHRLLGGGSLGKDLTKTAPFYTLQL